MRPEDPGHGRGGVNSQLHLYPRVEDDEVCVRPKGLVVVDVGVKTVLEMNKPVQAKIHDKPGHKAGLQVSLCKRYHLAKVFSKQTEGEQQSAGRKWTLTGL